MWPVLLAAAGFLYLWWLAALIFDLAFVWHRYVRRCVANQRLREWGPEHLRQSGDGHNQPEQCRNPARGSRVEPSQHEHAHYLGLILSACMTKSRQRLITAKTQAEPSVHLQTHGAATYRLGLGRSWLY